MGTEAVQAHWYLADVTPALHDIGLKRDYGQTLKGYLGDLMVFGDALNEVGIKRILGRIVLISFRMYFVFYILTRTK